MPRFFFNVDGDWDDQEGLELPSLAEAKCQAVRFAGERICDTASTFWDACDFVLTVSDENGLTLFSLHLFGTEAPAIAAAR